MHKIFSSLCLILLMSSASQAQDIGCFFDFRTGVCDGGSSSLTYPNYSTFVQNQQAYGFVAAQMIDTYLPAFQSAEQARLDNLNGWNSCLDNLTLCDTAVNSLNVANDEAINQVLLLSKKVKRLRRRIKALRR